ncbi:MAG: NAD(P)/FAD-dependent oxidoreductase [Clostridium sp.]|nr:NAD(P)/FAD-dependent oxidoreductase [Clostridium sp.]
MTQYDLIIIGGGASGLSAGVAALKDGVKKVLLLERNSDLGGNLNLFIHGGFGEYYFEKAVTGPELASELIKQFKALGGEYKIDTEVLELTTEKVVTYVNPREGIRDIKSNAIIIASGCREKFTGNINIPIHKYTGIYTVVSAHKLINLYGYLPGKKVVILGKTPWSLVLAIRLIVEGAKVNAIVNQHNNKQLNYRSEDILRSMDINIIEHSRVIELYGSERIEKIDVEDIIDKTITTIECDSLILSVGYFPDLGFIKNTNIKIYDKKDTIVNNRTSEPGIFACGTVVTRDSEVFRSGEDGFKVGKLVAEYLNNFK